MAHFKDYNSILNRTICVESSAMSVTPWKKHNAMWPGLVGKEEGSSQPPISLERMIELTLNSEVSGEKYDGIDLFLFDPHLNIKASKDEIKLLADAVAEKGLAIGTVVAPVWKDTGGGSAAGVDSGKFIEAVRSACEYASVLREHGVRSYGKIRIDSATSVQEWMANPVENTLKIAETFKECGRIAAGYGEVLAAEGEICWGGMHSWKDMLNLLEEVGMPETVGFQADLAHTYLYMLGHNAPEHALLEKNYSQEEFWSAYKVMTDALRPWTVDFHVAQNDGTVHGSGSHDKTGRHCKADDPMGKLDIVECSRYWLLDEQGNQRPEISHLCWDGCMFANEDLENQETWNTILGKMIEVSKLG